jgi:heat shock protein HslJ
MFYRMRCSFLFLALLLVSCQQAPKRVVPADPSAESKPAPLALNKISNHELLKREWMLVEFPGFDRDVLMKAQAKIDLRNFPQASLYLGCNRMGFQWPQGDTKQIEANSIIATKMACEDMQLEMRGADFLPSITTYQIKGHELNLSNDKAEVMRFIASDWD